MSIRAALKSEGKIKAELRLLGQENITYGDDTPVKLFYEHNGQIHFLGKGMRSISSANSTDKCEKVKQEYENLKIKAQEYLKNYRG